MNFAKRPPDIDIVLYEERPGSIMHSLAPSLLSNVYSWPNYKGKVIRYAGLSVYYVKGKLIINSI